MRGDLLVIIELKSPLYTTFAQFFVSIKWLFRPNLHIWFSFGFYVTSLSCDCVISIGRFVFVIFLLCLFVYALNRFNTINLDDVSSFMVFREFNFLFI